MNTLSPDGSAGSVFVITAYDDHARRSDESMKAMPGYRSPEDAAMSTFSSKYCRVIASRVEGDHAYVLLDTGSANRSYLYGVNCHLQNGEWHEGSSGNGGGWCPTDEDGELGYWALWDDAPAGADMVRVEFGDHASEHPTIGAAYLVVLFKTPIAIQPRVSAIRINGSWVEQPNWFRLTPWTKP